MGSSDTRPAKISTNDQQFMDAVHERLREFISTSLTKTAFPDFSRSIGAAVNKGFRDAVGSTSRDRVDFISRVSKSSEPIEAELTKLCMQPGAVKHVMDLYRPFSLELCQMVGPDPAMPRKFGPGF